MKKLLLTLMIISLLGTISFQQTAIALENAAPILVTVNGMVCDFCARALEKTFLKQAAVKSITIDLTAKSLTIHLNDGASLDDAEIEKLVRQAGYNLENISRP